MKLNALIFTLLAVSSSLAAAQGRTVSDPIAPDAFDKLDPATLDAGSIQYSENLLPFSDWITKSSAEAQVMNLYEGFVEPVVKYTNANNQPDTLTDYLTMYTARTKTVLNTPAAQTKLKLMIDIPTINYIEWDEFLDPELTDEAAIKRAKAVDPAAIAKAKADNAAAIEKAKADDMANGPSQGRMLSKPITIADLIHTKLKAGQPIDNFAWCNKRNPDDILKPAKETDLDYIGGKAWCTPSERTVCVESCYMFGTTWRAALKGEAAARAGKNLFTGGTNRREDLGVAMQSEIKYYVSEAEFGAKVPLSQLTHVNTPVRGVIERSTFYINQVFKFSKALTVIHEHPTDASKSIMVSIVTMGVRTHSLEKPMMEDHLKGEGLWNSDTGLSAGVPIFTQTLTKKIAEVLEGSAVIPASN